jgi:recombination associated protein RdgC
VIRRLKVLDIVQDEAERAAGDDPAERFDIDFSLMTLELRQFIPALVEAFGGEAE